MSKVRKVCMFTGTLSCLMFCGCFSSTRFVADVRPDCVKSVANIGSGYRISKVVIAETELLKEVRYCASKGYMGNPVAYNESRKQRGLAQNGLEDLALVSAVIESDLSELEAKHQEDEKKVRDSLEAALIRFYPEVFSCDKTAKPLTVLVSWGAKYAVDMPFYYPNIAALFWPLSAELETQYDVCVLEGDGRQIGQSFFSSGIDKGISVKAVRSSEVWETVFLPIGLIPVPGESNWPKKADFMKSNGAFNMNALNKINSKDGISEVVFDSDVDGEVLAAAVVRALNQKAGR